MIYDNENNPFNLNLLSEISEYFQSIRDKYIEYEGSLKGQILIC